ncbi:MAG: lycopene cyclase domain-containing protein [Melioribacteraceae bacterium]|nr:lycopene cyclase domain-containing protein [Melioribacteraceae bacterium]
MKYEYLIFNIIVLSGPLFFGSLKQFYFLDKLKNALLSILISAIPFLIWDAAVTDRHWFFASEYTLGFRLFGLPFEEILFFFTVPYACLFTWQMVKKYYDANLGNKVNDSVNIKITLVISAVFLIISIIAIIAGKEYTSLSALAFSLSILFDRYFGSKIFTTKRFLAYFLFVSFFTLIFNGYLTWRPIVTYDEIYQIGFRIFTIPIEDFFFGYALLILSTSLFEKLIGKNKRT